MAEKATLENGFGEGDGQGWSRIQRLADRDWCEGVSSAQVCRDKEIECSELRLEIHADLVCERRCLNGLATGEWRTVIAIVAW